MERILLPQTSVRCVKINDSLEFWMYLLHSALFPFTISSSKNLCHRRIWKQKQTKVTWTKGLYWGHRPLWLARQTRTKLWSMAFLTIFYTCMAYFCCSKKHEKWNGTNAHNPSNHVTLCRVTNFIFYQDPEVFIQEHFYWFRIVSILLPQS